jgi:hypothetical protein
LVIAAMIWPGNAGPAEGAGGSSTLPREVHCRNSILLAGKYDYSVDFNSPSLVVRLRKLDLQPLTFDS